MSTRRSIDEAKKGSAELVILAIIALSVMPIVFEAVKARRSRPA